MDPKSVDEDLRSDVINSKIKIRPLDKLRHEAPFGGHEPAGGTASNMSDVTIGDIVEHGDFVSSDESGVMHLKITNVMSVDESITGCTVSEDDRDVFANIQIASVTTILDDEHPDSVAESSANPSHSTAGQGSASVPLKTSNIPNSDCPTLKLVNVRGISKDLQDGTASVSPTITTMCIVPKSAAVSLIGQDKASEVKTYHSIIRSSVVVPHLCCHCSKRVKCDFRVLSSRESGGPADSSYLCSDKCKEEWLLKLPDTAVVEKPRKYFERVCGMCGHEINDVNKGLFSWETREFCNKLCLADHIGYVGQHCQQCRSTVRLLHMGKYCVRFGSDIYQFCSNTCLERYKQSTQVCCYCQKNLCMGDSSSQDSVVSISTNKKYCSTKCMKRALRKDINQQFYSEQKACTVCTGIQVPRFEFLKDGDTSYLCSQPCLNVYKFANSLKAVNCCLCLRLLCVESVTHFLYHNNGQLRVFCSTSCTNVFILSTRRIVTCCFCKVKKYNFDMIQFHEDSAGSFYCSVWCLNLHHQKTSDEDLAVDVATGEGPVTPPALGSSAPCSPPSSDPGNAGVPVNGSVTLAAPAAFSTSDVRPPLAPATKKLAPATKAPLPTTTPPVSQLTQCNMCQNVSPAQFHMVMSDNTLRNFCSYNCASRYKVTFGFLVSNTKNTNSTPASVPIASVASSLPARHETRAAAQLPTSAPPAAPPAVPTPEAPARKPFVNSRPKRTNKESPSNDTSVSMLRSFRGASPRTKGAESANKNFTEPFLERILASMAPKVMINKSTMCVPVVASSDFSTTPNPDTNKSSSRVERIFVPVPIPVYVPAPVAMYSLPIPVLVPVPVPVPVPVILPLKSGLLKESSISEDDGSSLFSIDPATDSDADESSSDTDAVKSTSGADAVKSTSGTDAVKSTSGSDAVKSTSGTDAVKSTSGTDAVKSTSGTDAVKSTSGTDAVKSTSGTDAVKSTLDTDAVKSTSNADAAKSTLKTDAAKSTLETDVAKSISLTDAEKSTSETGSPKSTLETDWTLKTDAKKSLP
ncbi:uncharacterized protein LOC108674401 isoform X2 [Hyalella azteca]|uniref:Uncharacterized protein LOC108674401 isoform X2 n=1 Tax=Hyalella azteca TaxID=294128 RepID=A0A8B7NY74_HYAAZ|nr:uncharacterized protein LOC108674401 isoform X2 [Hyalella azteca]